MTGVSEEILRIRDLEVFRDKLKIWFVGALCVSTVLGLGTLYAGVWVTILNENITTLQNRTGSLESKLDGWEAKVEEATKTLITAKNNQLADFVDQSRIELSAIQSEINALALQKKDELQKVDSSLLLTSLQDGTAELNLKKLIISNDLDKKVLEIGSDKNNNGFVLINDKNGNYRYATKIKSGNAITSYSNSDDKTVLYVGASTNDGKGLLQIINPKNGNSLLEIYSAEAGGYLATNNPNGRRLTYAGATDDTKVGIIVVKNPSNKNSLVTLTGTSGNGKITVNNEHGQTRYSVGVYGDRPQSHYYHQNTNVLSMGIYKDSSSPYLHLAEPKEGKVVAKMSADENGGHSFYFTENGKQLIYLGAGGNTGDALIKLHERYGAKINDLSPTFPQKVVN